MNTTTISYFKNIRQTKDGKDMPADVFLQYVHDGKWQDDVLAVRTGKLSKDQLPYVTLSGKFSERKVAGLLQHSGLICMDVDDVADPEELKSRVCTDPHVYAAFVSVSGKGLALLFKINPDKHLEAFQGLEEYLFTNFEIVTDPSCKDVSRPRYVSYDPHIYINSKADKFTIYPKKQPKAMQKLPEVVYVQSDFDSMIREIVERRVDLTTSYDSWVRIGLGLAEKFREGGRSYFHQISQFHPDYSPQLCDRKYDNMLKARGSGVTIATLYYVSKQAGIQTVTEQTRLIAQTAFLAKKGRRTQEDTVKLLEEADDIAPEDSEDIVRQVYENNIQVPTEDNPVDALETWLRQNYSFRRNLITRYIEQDGRPMQTRDFNSIYVAGRKVFEKLTYDLVDRVINSAFTPDYNPLEEFFARNRDRRPNGVIKALWASVETDTGLAQSEFFPDYLDHFGTKWLVGLVSAALGQHSPLMLVFAGERQGTGKTEFFRRLLPPELRSFYAESKLDREKDDELLMTQKLLIMDDEMGGKRSREEKRLKELLSKQTFSLREPYGRNNIDLQRLAVLAGTTNDAQILSDPTGNRRVIPVNVLSINHEAFNRVDKVDLLMEAYWLLKDGFKWELTFDDVKILNQNTGGFEATSAEYDLLMRYFELPKGEKDMLAQFLTGTEIKSHLELRTGQKLNHIRLGMELRKAGYERVTQRVKGYPVKGFIVVKRD